MTIYVGKLRNEYTNIILAKMNMIIICHMIQNDNRTSSNADMLDSKIRKKL